MRLISQFFIKTFNLIIGVPLIFAMTIIVLSVCLIDFLFFITPIGLIINPLMQGFILEPGPNNFFLQVVGVIVCVGIACFLYEILKVYVPKYFEFLKWYIKESFTFKL